MATSAECTSFAMLSTSDNIPFGIKTTQHAPLSVNHFTSSSSFDSRQGSGGCHCGVFIINFEQFVTVLSARTL